MILSKSFSSAILLLLLFMAFNKPIYAQTSFPEAKIKSSADLLLAIQKLNTVGSVLYLAAHPDDENTRMIAWLANERKVRTAYLSLTRGDGGQNLIGTEKGEELGLLRTQELLEARKRDGGEQLFTRAMDFGYSKTPEESYEIWGKELVLADVVWAIRSFKPDVIITRFPTTGEGGHGHHTASALLASEAYKLAADEKAFPEQLERVSTWQVKRVLWNSFSWNRKANEVFPGEIPVETGTYNQLLGKSYGEIAAEARSQHRCQGFGSRLQRGSNIEYVKNILGDSIEKDLLEDIDLSWNKLSGGKAIGEQVLLIAQKFDGTAPHKSVMDLLKVRKMIQKIQDKHWKIQKTKEIDLIIASCLGLYLDANTTTQNIAPGQELTINLEAINRSDVNVKLQKISINSLKDSVLNLDLKNNQFFQGKTSLNIPLNFPLSQPYWLAKNKQKGIYPPLFESKVAYPENEAAITVSYELLIENEVFTFNKSLQYKVIDPSIGEVYQPLVVCPPVVFELPKAALIFTNNGNRNLQFAVKSYTPNTQVKIKVSCPDNWSSSWSDTLITFSQAGEQQSLLLNINAPKSGNKHEGELVFTAVVNNQAYQLQRVDFTYPHIKQQTWFPRAAVTLSHFASKHQNKTIAYINGPGDDVPEALKQLGYQIDLLDNNALKTADLSKYKAIICGIRAYNTNTELGLYTGKLNDYVKNGGNYIVQYQTNNFIGSVNAKIGPNDFTIGRERVTKENAEVKILQEKHPIFNFPNKISAIDFEAWVQERGLYFASKWDNTYIPLLAMNDPNEPAQEGALIYQKYGKGNFYYSGLAFFRQLPAGVAGAYRLLVNMIESE